MSPATANVKAEGADVVPLHARETPPRVAADPAFKVTLYHFPTSLYSQQVRLALAEKGVAWEGKIINIGPAHEHFAPWYAKINPRLVVPTLEVDGTIVTDATHIVQYIDSHFGGPTLMPDDPDARAEALSWMQRETELPMRELVYVRSKGLTRWLQRRGIRQRIKQLIKLRKRYPELDDIYAAKIDDLTALEKALDDRRATTDLVESIEILLDDLELALTDRKWLAGDHYSLADLVWTAVIARLEHIGFARSLSLHRRPNVNQWYMRLRERSSWNAMIRHLTASQVIRFYGPAALKAFLIFWVLKWALVGGGLWLIKYLISG